jgi:predicted lipoprotein with Yx(FWY)xxD motif
VLSVLSETGVEKPMKRNLFLIAGVMIAVVLIAGCTSPSPPATPTPTAGTTAPTTVATTAPSNGGYTVMTTSNSQLGTFLVDSKGVTLYNFTIDSYDKSACTGGCVGVWPVFYTSTVTVPSNLKASDFTSFTRSDGKMQTAYKGMPLYYYIGDTGPGTTTGNALNQFGGLWYVVPLDAKGYPK